MSRGGTAYRQQGEATAPAVVLIHGMGLDSGMWRPYEDALAENYRVLSYDLSGHGDSPSPSSPPTLRLFSEQLHDLLDELQIDRCALVGFSLGGIINRHFAQQYPSRTAALVILNSPHERDAAAQSAVEANLRQVEKAGVASTLAATLDRWLTPEYRAEHPQIIETLSQRLLANDPDFYRHCRRLFNTAVGEVVRPQPPLRMPTLVITCEDDRGNPPAMSHAIANDIAAAEVLIVPRLRHLGLLEAPEQFLPPIETFFSALDPWRNNDGV